VVDFGAAGGETVILPNIPEAIGSAQAQNPEES